MKKLLALFLCMALCLVAVIGCGDTVLETQEEDEQEINEEDVIEGDEESDDEFVSEEPEEEWDGGISSEDVRYVMIYNPEIYEEENEKALSTGDLKDCIELDLDRADELEMPATESGFVHIPVGTYGGDVDLTGVEFDVNRAGGLYIPYEVGDTEEFYYGMDERQLGTFECLYVGEYCCIWTINEEASMEVAEATGEEFDNKIYESVTDLFGYPRYTYDGDKVNILMYNLSGGCTGFVMPYEIFSDEEVPEGWGEKTGLNTGKDIMNIDPRIFYHDEEALFSTMAHEFQHLICANSNMVAMFCFGKSINVWLNESMSGFVEEWLYPGVQEENGRYRALHGSDGIRHGQSLYNFNITSDDIGVYGSVYLFSEYLANLTGEDSFKEIHSYWQNISDKNFSEPESIADSMSSKAKKDLESKYDFSDLDFVDENEELLSKITLDFYISTISDSDSKPEALDKVKAKRLLYDEINPADIEGGGRILVSVSEEGFTFPEDADEGLVYIGFDEDFNVITDCIIK